MPSREEKAHAYFESVVKKYIVHDIEYLLTCCDRDGVEFPAGPLLAATVNAIDLLAGVRYGFNTSVGTRYIKCVRNELKMSRLAAKCLYYLVRCGVAHEGVTKLRIKYFADRSSHENDEPLTQDAEESTPCLRLDVVALARRFLRAVREIDPRNIRSAPIASPEDRETFTRATSPGGLPRSETPEPPASSMSG